MLQITKERLVKIIQNKQWLIQGFNGLPIYLHNVASQTGWMIKNVAGVNYTHFFLRMEDNRAKYYYDEQDLANIGYGYYKKNKNIRDIQKLVKQHKGDYLKAKRLSGQIPKQLEKLSFTQLINLAQKLSYELKMSIGITHAIEGISFVSELKLKEILNKRYNHTQENFQLLSSPVKPSFLSLAQTALWNIRHAKKNQKQKIVKKFLRKFGWIDNSYVKGKILTTQEVLKKASHQKHQPFPEMLKQTKFAKSKLIKELSIHANELFVIKTVEICTPWQDTRKKLLMQTIGRFEPVLEEMAKRLKLTTAQFKYICPEELNYKTLNNKNFINQLSCRFPRSDYYALKNKNVIFSGKDVLFVEKHLKKPNQQYHTELKGMIACKGKVVGKVKICRSVYDIPKLKKGEILVASMTRPEFLPAMQRASAFVTDEGGITSHAAIISREMNKPCIIGTKIATEIFKDGDKVLVDGNLGIVKKL